MATTLQARVASRGFPVFDVSGQSGQGALPDSTLPGVSGPGQPAATWTDPNVDPGSVAATLAPPEEYILGQMGWGLPAAPRPDDTPRTHAAPVADPTLAWQDGGRKNSEGIAAYNAELEAAHAPGFSGWEIRRRPGSRSRWDYSGQETEGNGDTNLAPVSPAMRDQAGYDGAQGYGGYAGLPEHRGLNGTNGTMPLAVMDRSFPGETYHGVFLNAAEVPLLTADAGQFIPAAPEFGPWMGGGFDGPTASVSAQENGPAADVPAQGPPLAPAGGLLPLWGS